MKSLFNYKLPIALFTVTALATAANAACERYKDCSFEVVKTTDVVYAKDVPQLKEQHNLSALVSSFGQSIAFYKNETNVEKINLKMDIFTPTNDGGAEKRAAVIVAHGGAFVAGAKDDSQKSIGYCGSLAARGFVTASIQYRTGVTLTDGGTEIPADAASLASALLMSDSKYEMTIDADNYARAVYRGVQDINAAVRYLRANATTYGVDPERIYVLGNSAGAIMSIENIYTNNKEDFPDYIEDGVLPNLGGLNDYGEQGVDAHANGAVALWGATHDPSTLGYNKTPIFLAHGTSDGTVLYGTGKPMSSYSISRMLPSDLEITLQDAIRPNILFLKFVLSKSYPQLATLSDDEATVLLAEELKNKIINNITLNIDAPVLYGSHVIDSALTVNNGSKKKPVTLFVDGAGHEFYDESADKEKAVKDGVFDFLYNLAKSDKIVRELAGVTIARANDNPDSVYAVIDGGYDGTDIVNIPSDIKVASVSFNREFTPSVYSTLTLPFSVNTNKVNGLAAVLRYNGLGKKDGKDAIRMKVVWATGDWVSAHEITDAEGFPMTYENVELAANTPYLVQMNAKTFSVNSGINDPITLKETPTTETDVSIDGWTFRGTWEYKKWGPSCSTEKQNCDPETGYAYGFAASESKENNIDVGDFVKVGEGAWISPLRAYLVKQNLQKARANGAYAIRPSELPEFMSVVIDNEDGNEEHTTVIGQFNTRTGEFRMNNAGARTYDLKGRYVGDKANKARGAYYGKKVLK